MGNELRRVPKGWEHPKNQYGDFIPMDTMYYPDVVDEWYNEHKLWLEGNHPDQKGFDDTEGVKFYEMWNGICPSCEYYNPDKWTLENATSFQLYENSTEGTPIGPVIDTMQDLKEWLLKNGYGEGNFNEVINNPTEMVYKKF